MLSEFFLPFGVINVLRAAKFFVDFSSDAVSDSFSSGTSRSLPGVGVDPRKMLGRGYI